MNSGTRHIVVGDGTIMMNQVKTNRIFNLNVAFKHPLQNRVFSLVKGPIHEAQNRNRIIA